MVQRLEPRWNVRAATARLRVLCPTNYPVRVVRPKGMVDWGDTDLVKRGGWHYRIRLRAGIERTVHKDVAVWVLVHEWAEAMSWPMHLGVEPTHSPHFGIAYSRTYRAIYDSEDS